jgi:deoxycytidine triphosphate deaminase
VTDSKSQAVTGVDPVKTGLQIPEGLGEITKAFWVDPDPSWQGMLSSDLIAYYNEEVGGMIGPWNDDLLKPASYELTLGPKCVVDGEPRTLTEEDPWLEIPENSIVFVSMAQWLRLPHYLAARFDLAIEFVYQGILLGTGPQVDPGFRGYLSCPLHNISDGSVHMRLGDPFAKMDFAKTSGLWKVADAGTFDDEASLYQASKAGTLTGAGSKPVRLFNDKKWWRAPIIARGYAGGKSVKSSVKALEDQLGAAQMKIAEFGDGIRRLRRFGLAAAAGVVLAVASLLLALAQLDRSYTDSKVEGAEARLGRATPAEAAAAAATAEKLTTTQRELAELRAQVAELRGRVGELTRPRP